MKAVNPSQNIFIKLLLIIGAPIYWLSKLIPKNHRLVCFGSAMGKQFIDNSKYLFHYMLKSENDIKCVWVTREKSIYKQLIAVDYPCVYFFSLKGIMTVLRAKICILSHRLKDISPLLTGGATIIQLWHGTPLKKIGFDNDWQFNKSMSFWQRTINHIKVGLFKYLPYLNYMHCDYLSVSSYLSGKSLLSAFKLHPKNILHLGQPRNDYLTGSAEFVVDKYVNHKYLNTFKSKFKYVVVWLPTHRFGSIQGINSLLENYKFSHSGMIEFLQKQNAILIIKAHFIELSQINSELIACKNIHIYEESDPYPLLRNTDILITDYSSVYFDFLRTGRPIVFAPFDLEMYLSQVAKLYYNYTTVAPGPICVHWQAVVEALESIVKKDEFVQQRNELDAQINIHEGQSCIRITEFIKRKLT